MSDNYIDRLNGVHRYGIRSIRTESIFLTNFEIYPAELTRLP